MAVSKFYTTHKAHVDTGATVTWAKWVLPTHTPTHTSHHKMKFISQSIHKWWTTKLGPLCILQKYVKYKSSYSPTHKITPYHLHLLANLSHPFCVLMYFHFWGDTHETKCLQLIFGAALGSCETAATAEFIRVLCCTNRGLQVQLVLE